MRLWSVEKIQELMPVLPVSFQKLVCGGCVVVINPPERVTAVTHVAVMNANLKL
jgi:hypothetical protein